MLKVDQESTKTLVAVHGWSGVFLGVLLYAVLVTGMVAVFAEEIGHWSSGIVKTDNPLAAGLVDNTTPVNDIVTRLSETVDDEYKHEVGLGMTTAGYLNIFFHRHQTNEEGQIEEVGTQFEVDVATGEVIERRQGTGLELFLTDEDRALSRFLVSVHTELHLPRPWGLILTGILGLAMMVAAVSGFIIHRHFFRDIFTLRKSDNPVLTVKDAHTVAGSWGLPFAFVLAFTGSFFSFAGSVGLPVMAMVGFGGDQEKMFEVIIGTNPAEDPTPSTGAPVDYMISDANQRTGITPGFAVIEHYNRADSMVTVFLDPAEGEISGKTLVYEGDTGEFVREKPFLGQEESVGGSFFSLMGPLHFGNFMGILSKAVWAALGFAMCYVTVTGMRMWLERRPEASFEPLRWSLSLMTFGIPIAMLGSAYAFFFTFGTGGASLWTQLGFLIGAAGVFGYAAFLKDQAVTHLHLKYATGVGCLLLVVVRMLSGGPGWAEAIAADQAIIVTLDMLLIFSAGAIAMDAWRTDAAENHEAETVKIA